MHESDCIHVQIVFDNKYKTIVYLCSYDNKKKLRKALDFIQSNPTFIEICEPPIVENGEIQCEVIPARVGDECQVVCDTGYASSPSTVTCGNGNEWTDILRDTQLCIGENHIFLL